MSLDLTKGGMDADDIVRSYDNRTPDQVEADARLKAANARKAEDWFEIFQEVTESGIYFMAQHRNDKEFIYEKLRARRPVYKRIKAEFKAIGLDLSEKFLLAGMDQKPDGTWFQKGDIKIAFKTRKEVVTFKGDDGQVAFNFFSWWHSFKAAVNPTKLPGVSPILH